MTIVLWAFMAPRVLIHYMTAGELRRGPMRYL